MLFPLNYQHEDKSVVNNGEPEVRMTPEQIQDDVSMRDLDKRPIYEGPQTQSHTKALMKANLIMNECYQIESTFAPSAKIARREWINSLIYHFLHLQALCACKWLCDLVQTGAHHSS